VTYPPAGDDDTGYSGYRCGGDRACSPGHGPSIPTDLHQLVFRCFVRDRSRQWTLSELAQEVCRERDGIRVAVIRRAIWDCVTAGVFCFEVDQSAMGVGLRRRRLALSLGEPRLDYAVAHARHRSQAVVERASLAA
jgi:hypothetical protein